MANVQRERSVPIEQLSKREQIAMWSLVVIMSIGSLKFVTGELWPVMDAAISLVSPSTASYAKHLRETASPYNSGTYRHPRLP